ncbi:MAG: DUF2857 domain-containing protein [Pseudomonadales bacterium]
MNSAKESDLVTAVLLYAVRCLAEGDQQALREMGLGPREIDALRGFEMADLYRLGALKTHCVAINFDRDVFWPLIAHLQSARQSEEVQRDLIQRDAPLEMMRSLFGMGSREYTRLRRILAVQPAVGRPPEPDEDMAHHLWRVISAEQDASEDDELTPMQYLRINETTDASLRSVWRHVQRWSEFTPSIGRCGAGASRRPAPSTAERTARP